MKGRVHRGLRTAILVCVAVVVSMLLALRGGHLSLPAQIIFPAFLALLACPTLFWWAWMDEWIAWLRSGDAAPGPKRRGVAGAVRGLLALYAVGTLVPILLLLFNRRAYDALPVPLLMWLMTWHLSVAVAGLVGLAIWLPWVLVRRVRGLLVPQAPPLNAGEARDQPKTAAAPPAHRLSRRSVITGAVTCAPMVLAGGSVLSGLRQQGRFVVRHVDLHLPRLPERLRGLTITHLSDFHVGRLFRPEHLDRVVEATNRLDSDLIAITGDTVDHSADFLPAACDAFSQMRSRYGRFVVIGNHDLIDSARHAVAYLEKREPQFLSDRYKLIDIGGERVRIAGLFWSRYDRANFGGPGHYERVETTLGSADPGVFTIALAHHPHAFDALADANVDLTLAGHTHGGQLMLTPPGSANPIGGGNLLFRYIWGEYRRGDSAMYVSSGVGNWFPVRVNAPAEIVQIRLI